MNSMNADEAKAKLDLIVHLQIIASFSPQSAIVLQFPHFYQDVQRCVQDALIVCGDVPDANPARYFEQLQQLQATISEIAYPLEADGKRTYWMSWYAKDTEIVPDFSCWITGETMDEPPEYTFCAQLRAESLRQAVEHIQAFYSDYRARFGHAMATDAPLGDRFQT